MSSFCLCCSQKMCGSKPGSGATSESVGISRVKLSDDTCADKDFAAKYVAGAERRTYKKGLHFYGTTIEQNPKTPPPRSLSRSQKRSGESGGQAEAESAR